MSRTTKDSPFAKDRFSDREYIAQRYIRLGLDIDTSMTYEVV